MLEEAIPSIWASFHSWLTPTVLFVLLNIVIGTIAVTRKGIRRDADASEGEPRKLFRSPSFGLDRLLSFNLHRYRSVDIPLETTPPPPSPRSEPLETLHASPDPAIVTESGSPEADAASKEHQRVSRSQSDVQPTAGQVPVKLAAKMKKSAFGHFEAEEAEVMRPQATARARTGRREAEEEEEEEEDKGGEVDARADDFINRFRQQLKLQRLNSILRYREMLNRGSGN